MNTRTDRGRLGSSRHASEPREGQVFRGSSLLSRYASFVKLPHTLFALPFAGVGVVFASARYPDRLGWRVVLLVVLAFAAARFAAMGFNRIVDRQQDALNPRTQLRELPSGRLSLGQAGLAVAVAAIVFLVSAGALNPLCGVLAPVALAWVFFYSYTKRFTLWSHHVLGLALGMAPVGAYLAVAGRWADPWYALPVLALAVTFWVAGFDVIYALQDMDFDRAQGLRSIPARLGPERALQLAGLFHAISVALLFWIWAGQLFPVGPIFLTGIGVMVLLLGYEHRLAAGLRSGRIALPRLDRVFFQANVGVSTSLLLLTLLDRMVR